METVIQERNIFFPHAVSQPSFLISTFNLKAWLVLLVIAVILPEGCLTMGKLKYNPHPISLMLQYRNTQPALSISL